MDLTTNHKAIQLLRQILDHNKPVSPKIKTKPQKPPFDENLPLQSPFPRSAPELHGLSSEQTAGFLAALRDDPTLDLHNVMILHDGQVIAEAAFNGYDPRVWHITHSECKSITGLAIGMLIGEGHLSLDDKIVRLFDKRSLSFAGLIHKNLTVRNLLTMSSGVVFNEAGLLTETDWVRCYLESASLSEPGGKFHYNSMNTYMLSAIVKEVSGLGLTDFLAERLWQPLGINGIFWEKCPKGIEKGGWGLYIRQEDMAKIGQLVLQDGSWNGRQLISREYLHAATTAQIAVPPVLGRYDYGYQIWVSRQRDAFLFNGMYGQNVLGLRPEKILIVVNSGNDEFFQQSSFFDLVEKYFPAVPKTDKPMSVDRRAVSLIKAAVGKPVSVKPDLPDVGWFPHIRPAAVDRSKFCEWLDGKILLAGKGEAASVGLLPLLAQLVQNNFTKGLKSIVFRMIEDTLQLTVNENDESHHLLIGFDKPLINNLKIHGEPYRVAVRGQLTADDDGNPVLKIRLSFQEIANARQIRLVFKEGSVESHWTEQPGKAFFLNALALVKDGVKPNPLVDALLDKADNDYVRYKITRCIEPEVTLRPVTSRAIRGSRQP